MYKTKLEKYYDLTQKQHEWFLKNNYDNPDIKALNELINKKQMLIESITAPVEIPSHLIELEGKVMELAKNWQQEFLEKINQLKDIKKANSIYEQQNSLKGAFIDKKK